MVINDHTSRSGKFASAKVPYVVRPLTTSIIGSAARYGFGAGLGTYLRGKGASGESSLAMSALASGVPVSKLQPFAQLGTGSPSPKPTSPSPKPTSPSPAPTTGAGDGVQDLDYLYADLAKAYGMDASTAYQEALSNTSYQRAVADLKSAGLNPVLAATSLSGAGGVYNPSILTQVGPGVVSSGRSSAHANYKFLSSFGQVALGLGSLLLTRNPYKSWTAASAGKMIFGSLGNILDGNF